MIRQTAKLRSLPNIPLTWYIRIPLGVHACADNDYCRVANGHTTQGPLSLAII